MKNKFLHLINGFAISGILVLFNITIKAEKKPNILLIITDDQRYDAIHALSEHEWLQTPAMDQLVSEGVTFIKAYGQSPSSAPSRAVILSGRYPHNNGVYGFENYPDTSSVLRPWLPEILSGNGYECALFGKDGTGRRNYNERFRKWVPFNKKYFSGGFVQLGDYTRARKKIPVDGKGYDEKKLGFITRTNKGGVIIGGTHPKPSGQTVDAYIAEDAINFINSKKTDEKQPFYLHVGFQFPHTPVLVPKPFDTMYNPDKMKIPEFTSDEFNKMSPQIQQAVDRFGMHGLTNKQIRQTIAHYYAYVTYGDRYFGEVVNAFKKKSQEQNREWIIIFASDNGWHLGEHGMNAKFVYYKESVHLPLVVATSNNRFPKGLKCENIAEFVDIIPTILAFANIDFPEYLDGYDLHSVLNELEKREEAISEEFHVMRRGMVRGAYKGNNYLFSMRTRTEGFKRGVNMNWIDTAPNDKLDIHLFNTDTDPDEINNLANIEEYRETVQYFKSRLIKRLFSERVEPRWHEQLEQRSTYSGK